MIRCFGSSVSEISSSILYYWGEDGKKRGVGAYGVRGRRNMVFLCTAASRDCLAGFRAPDIGTGGG